MGLLAFSATSDVVVLVVAAALGVGLLVGWLLELAALAPLLDEPGDDVAEQRSSTGGSSDEDRPSVR